MKLALSMVTCVIASLLTPIVVSRAYGQDAEQVALAARAAEAFQRGEAAFAENDYVAALAAFEEAQRLAPHDAVRFNIAVCLESLARFREAWLQYRAGAASQQLDSSARAQASQNAQRVRQRLGVVAVAEPVGASVVVDGERRCAAPCETETDPGEHEVRVIGALGEATVRVSVERGARLDVGVLTPLTAPGLPPERTAEPTRRARHGPGWLLGVGSGLTALGIAGAIGFGVRTDDLLSSYEAMAPPASRQVYDEGLLMQGITNVSIAVSLLGAALMAIDLILALDGNGTELSSRGEIYSF